MTEPNPLQTPDLPPADPEALARETTPVADSLQNNPAAAAEAEDESQGGPTGEPPKVARSYQVDVSRALERKTHDGPGDEDPGPSDWQGYATDGVEVTEVE